MRKSIILLVACLSGCLPGGIYHQVSDGRRADATPDLLAKFQVAKAICEGEAAKAALAGGPSYNVTQRELATRGCMASHGYIVKPN
jgi:hypothetical protein